MLVRSLKYISYTISDREGILPQKMEQLANDSTREIYSAEKATAYENLR